MGNISSVISEYSLCLIFNIRKECVAKYLPNVTVIYWLELRNLSVLEMTAREKKTAPP
jgi:hypothetical protein